MDRFNKDHKLIDLIDANYDLLPVISRFGIKLGLRDKSVEDICNGSNINTDFFLAIVNTFHNKDYFPEKELRSFSPLLIIDYLRKTHNYYINYILPKLERLIDQLIQSNTTDNQQLSLIEMFYSKYRNELLLHIRDEEENVFPYIINLVNEKKTDKKYNVLSFEKEHSNVDIKLNDLKNLVIKYIQPEYDENLCHEFLITLFRFEKDISDHARIEDNILIPQVIEIEKEIHG